MWSNRNRDKEMATRAYWSRRDRRQDIDEVPSALLDQVAKGVWSRTTARHYLSSVKSFVRWLWLTDAIPALPRVLDAKTKELKISKTAPSIVTFDKEEVSRVLNAASDRTKLYILLMLNCGMTQKDIADLHVAEVDSKAGRIIRKRSKTADCDNVPVVNYRLWPETFRLLQAHRSTKSIDLVLLAANGSPLWLEQAKPGGKIRKIGHFSLIATGFSHQNIQFPAECYRFCEKFNSLPRYTFTTSKTGGKIQ